MGSSTGTQKAQLDRDNAQQDQQLKLSNAATAANSAALTPYLSGNMGYSAAQLAALRSSAIDQNAAQYAAANRTLNANLTARGEGMTSPLSGVAAGGFAGLAAARASDLADANRTVTLNNAQQANTNMFNAASVLSGGAQTYAGNAASAGSGANSALSNYTQAQSNGFLSQFGRGLGAGLGSGVSAGLTGGIGTSLSKLGWGKS